MEKLCKLKDDLQDKEGEIRQLVDYAMDSHGLVQVLAFYTPVRKHSAHAADMDSPSGTMKKAAYDTPIGMVYILLEM